MYKHIWLLFTCRWIQDCVAKDVLHCQSFGQVFCQPFLRQLENVFYAAQGFSQCTACLACVVCLALPSTGGQFLCVHQAPTFEPQDIEPHKANKTINFCLRCWCIQELEGCLAAEKVNSTEAVDTAMQHAKVMTTFQKRLQVNPLS